MLCGSRQLWIGPGQPDLCLARNYGGRSSAGVVRRMQRFWSASNGGCGTMMGGDLGLGGLEVLLWLVPGLCALTVTVILAIWVIRLLNENWLDPYREKHKWEPRESLMAPRQPEKSFHITEVKTGVSDAHTPVYDSQPENLECEQIQISAATLALKPMRGTLLISAGLQGGAVILGHFAGLEMGYSDHPPKIFTNCALLAGLLMLNGIVASLLCRPTGVVRYRTAVCVGSLLYSVGVVLRDPFLHINQYRNIVMAILVLVPLLLVIGYHVRGKAWLSAAGVTLFVFTSTMMIAYNTSVSDFGSGFFSFWF